MAHLIKVFLRGLLTTVLLPVIVTIWVLYGVYCLFTFIGMFFVSIVNFFKGKSLNGELKEDIEARRIILEKEKEQAQTQEAVNFIYQNAVQQMQNQMQQAAAQQVAQQAMPYAAAPSFDQQPAPNPSIAPTPAPIEPAPASQPTVEFGIGVFQDNPAVEQEQAPINEENNEEVSTDEHID